MIDDDDDDDDDDDEREIEGKDKEDMNETWPMCLVDSPIAYGN